MPRHSILILASSVFYYGTAKSDGPASLFDAYDLIKDLVGKGAPPLHPPLTQY